MLKKLIFEWLFKLRIKKNNVQVEGFKEIKTIVIIINLDENKTCDLEALTHSFEKLAKKFNPSVFPHLVDLTRTIK